MFGLLISKIPYWTRVSNCIDAHKDMCAFYKDGIRTGPIKEVRMHCIEEYNRYVEWGF